MIQDELRALAVLLQERNQVDAKIAQIIDYPALPGHIGEFIASRIFDIDLAASASNKSYDGHFRSGPLAGKSVNVKFTAKNDGLLNLSTDGHADYYLVLAGPRTPPMSSKGSSLPFGIESVFLFAGEAIEKELKARNPNLKIGVATSVPRAFWDRAEIYPDSRNTGVVLSAEQVAQLESFAPAATNRPTSGGRPSMSGRGAVASSSPKMHLEQTSGAETLVIIPCGKAKIWDEHPGIGAVPARHAYTGSPFKTNLDYAVTRSSDWRILSAKYGFIEGDYVIPGPYDASFKDPRSGPVEVQRLVEQISDQGLARFERVVCLGGKEYLRAAREAFAAFGIVTQEPFAGLPVGMAMHAIQSDLRGPAQSHLVAQQEAPLASPKPALDLAKLVPRKNTEGRGRLPGASDFRAALDALLAEEARRGATFVEVRAGDLHRQAGGGSGADNRMPPCCDAMRSRIQEGDEVISEPPKGRGSTLTIRYRLLRQLS